MEGTALERLFEVHCPALPLAVLYVLVSHYPVSSTKDREPLLLQACWGLEERDADTGAMLEHRLQALAVARARLLCSMLRVGGEEEELLMRRRGTLPVAGAEVPP